MKNTIGTLGVWSFIDNMSATETVNFCRRLEQWGYGALWIPEAVGRDPFTTISYLAANTQSLVFCTGIANIYARDAMSMNAIRQTLSELVPGRFMLGMGVSHAPLVADIRGHDYKKPVTTMRNYLDAMDSSLFMSVPAPESAPIVLAALRTNMLKLAAERTSGAHPYFVPPEHTAKARETLGKDALLCPEQMVLLESDPDKARAIARQHMATYIDLPNYRNNLLETGFTTEDFENGGSDKLVDAIVAWGSEESIRDRIQAHWDAGADHVCIQPFKNDGEMGPDETLLELLAPG
ncbi:MAG: TIGR03620 family F420-dependent LLM class oxidoreductase [Gammaproteobacteria bacterium]|jgi:probable F420-dependent oxidoreductase|nr:TIGR03620 family F420-dependent LLM class oxidoreductase [Gammaproteobacteria bacterium]